jgi:serine/threonine-protein kinase HipA
MARPTKSRSLSVWMNGERVGEWRRPIDGGQQFTYDDSWLTSPTSRPISLSFPLRPAADPYREGVVEFFENLLPDNRAIRERIQRRFGAASTGAFDLLREIGRDCVGALQLLPEDAATHNVRTITADPLTNRDVAEILAGTLDPGFGRVEQRNNAFRISLAGAQEKTALLKYKGHWHQPIGTTPTSHILKLPLGTNPQGIDLSTSVENEWLCAQLAQAFDIPTAHCQIDTFGEQKVLIVERFDRRLADDENWFIRLPQEDFCQATATAPSLKYEGDGGPGIEKIMNLLLGAQNPIEDRRDFMRTQLIFWMLAAIDGHAKNFSLFLLPGGAYRLTPRYDMLSAYPVLGHGRGKLSPHKIKMAMAVRGKNRHYLWKEISARHWVETARRCGLSNMKSVLEEVIERTPTAVAHVRDRLPRSFPAGIAETILTGTLEAVERLKEQMGQL